MKLQFTDHKFGGQLLGVANCPHCNVADPLLRRVFSLVGNQVPPRGDGGQIAGWCVYRCASCGHLITAKGEEGDTSDTPRVAAMYPAAWSVSEVVPDRVANYLIQAHQTIMSPDASVLMSASSVDAMLKDHNLPEGSLHKRIDMAVKNGDLTQKLADWAHMVRLDTINRRYSAVEAPPMSKEDAKRAFEFANALTEFLYVIPSRVPEDISEPQDISEQVA